MDEQEKVKETIGGYPDNGKEDWFEVIPSVKSENAEESAFADNLTGAIFPYCGHGKGNHHNKLLLYEDEDDLHDVINWRIETEVILKFCSYLVYHCMVEFKNYDTKT